MKGLETAAIVLAAISFIITIIFKMTGTQLFVTTTGIWRFTVVCLGFAVWARLAQADRYPASSAARTADVSEMSEESSD